MEKKYRISLKLTNKQIILWICLVLWMSVIFMFSAQNGEDSAELSGGITEQVIKIMVEDYEEMTPVQQENVQNNVSFIVRKTAHFTEYAILGAILVLLVGTYTSLLKWRMLISWCAGTVYAMTDEFHQTFSDGRSPKVFDVCVDSAGVIFGVAIMLAFCYIAIDKRKRKKLS